jgi:hypothetical protein
MDKVLKTLWILQVLKRNMSLLEILSFATNHYATSMQLVVICNYKFSIV